MRMLLTGGTGLIGRALCRHWQSQGHELWVLSRHPAKVLDLGSSAGPLQGCKGITQLEDLDTRMPFDAVVNLAGAPIADRPWTQARQQELWRSRIDTTRQLVDWVARLSRPPQLLVSGSAVGWYGDGQDQELNEASASATADFGARLCAAWEQEALRAAQQGVRVVLLRIAPVLAPQGGMLARLLPVFRMGLGGRLGSGRQWMPWIHIDDLVSLMDHVLHQPNLQGPVNACAPHSARNTDFTRALAHAVHRPALLPAPAWVLRFLLGEMSVLLLGGQRLSPMRAQATGFSWRYPELDAALADCLHLAAGAAR